MAVPRDRAPAAAAAMSSVAQIDPMGVMTPEFRARLIRDAAERAARNARMGLSPAEPASQLAATKGPKPDTHAAQTLRDTHVTLSLRGSGLRPLVGRNVGPWAINSGARIP
jgi:hypothetical protein